MQKKPFLLSWANCGLKAGLIISLPLRASGRQKFALNILLMIPTYTNGLRGLLIQSRMSPIARLVKLMDSVIAIVGGAQEKDGYLYTFRSIHAAKPHDWIGSKRWVKEEDLSHELYNSGHLYEAAYAHYNATGKKSLLNIALKNADLLANTFGYGKLELYPGHQIIETGLVKLYRITHNKKYLDLAKFFLDVRGPGGNSYNQANKKVVRSDRS